MSKPAPPTSYKDYEVEVETGGRNYAERPGPKANGGCDRAGLVNSGTGLATFSFSDESLYITPGSVFASRLWDVEDGTITVGSATSATITATFPLGRRYISLTVTDDEGDSHTHYILVAALSKTDATWKPILSFEVIEDRETETGKAMSFIVTEDIPPNIYYEGVEIIYFEVESYAGVVGSLAGPESAEGVKFVGWLSTERESPEATLEYGVVKGTEVRCISTGERLRQLVLLPQLLQYKASPDEWDEIARLDTPRMAWYIMNWHSTALLRANFLLPGGFDEALKRWATTAGDLWGQLEETAKARAQRFTCDKRGILRMVGNVQIQDPTERTSTVITTIGADDISAYSFERKRAPDLYWVDGSGITIGQAKSLIAALFSIAPGDAPGQGSQRSVYGGLIVDDQTQLNQWTGCEYARLNSPWLPLQLTLMHTGDIDLMPALQEWLTVTIPSTSNRRGQGLTSQRCLVTEISITHANDIARTKEVVLTCWIEIPAYEAETRVVQPGGAEIPDTIIVGGDIYPVIDPSPLGGMSFDASPAGYILPYGGAAIHRVRNMTTGATWEADIVPAASLTNSLDIVSYCHDAWNPLNALYVLCRSTVDRKFEVHYVENLNASAGSQVFTHLLTIDDCSWFGTPGYTGSIQSSINVRGGVYVAVGYSNSGATYLSFQIQRRSSYTGAWQGYAPASVNSTLSAAMLDLGKHAASATSGKMYFAGLDAIYESSNMGASWTGIRDVWSGRTTQVHVPYNNNPSDTVVYASGGGLVDGAYVFQRRNPDGTWSGIAPFTNAVGGSWYLPVANDVNWPSIHTYTNNRLILSVLASASVFGPSNLILSDTGGDDWTIGMESSGLHSLGGWPNNPDILWFNGYKTYSGAKGIWWTDKRNLDLSRRNMLGDYESVIGTYTGHYWFTPVEVPG